MDPVEESDDDQYLDFAEYLGGVADGHGPGPGPGQADDMWDDVYNDYMGDDDEGVWGYNGSDAEDYLDDYFLGADYQDSDEEELQRHEDYFRWEEDSSELSDRYLTNWSQMKKPGQTYIPSDRGYNIPSNSIIGGYNIPSNSIIGPSWERMKKARETMSQEMLMHKEQVSYEQLYKLAVQSEKMLAAWKKRKEKSGVTWEVKRVEGKLGNLTEPVEYNENMTVPERIKYSVEKLMEVLGNSSQLDKLSDELSEVKTWLQKHMMESLNSCLPQSLPYPALSNLFKVMYNSTNSNQEDAIPQLGLMDLSEAEILVEENYMVRLYLSMADVYNLLREIMFRHPNMTRSKEFKETCRYILSRIQPNFALIKALHGRQTTEDQSTSKHDIPKITNSCIYVKTESIPISTNADIDLSNKFIVTIDDHADPWDGRLQMKPEIKIFNTETGKLENDFSLNIQPCSKGHTSKGLIYRGKTTVSIVENLILYSVLFTTEDPEPSFNEWECTTDETSQGASGGQSSNMWRCIVVDWRKGQHEEEITIEGEIYQKIATFSFSKIGAKIWIAHSQMNENINMWSEDSSHSLKVFEAGNESPKLILDRCKIIALMKNWLVIQTKVEYMEECDQEKLMCVKWLNLITYKVVSEDIYPASKVPSICFDNSSQVDNEESLKFVQANDIGQVEIWEIDHTGRKEILLRCDLEMPEVETNKQERMIQYSHPYLLSYNMMKLCVYNVKEIVPERQVVFINDSPGNMLNFHTFPFKHTDRFMRLDGSSIVMIMFSIGNFSFDWIRFEFDKDQCDVITEDIKSAKSIKTKIEAQKLLDSSTKEMTKIHIHSDEEASNEKQGGACGWLGWSSSNGSIKTKRIDDIIKSGERVPGELTEWNGSHGYLKLDSLKDSPKIHLHINNIKYGTGNCVPIAPKPSAMHLNAAIALSELAAANQFTPKADVGIQTDIDVPDRRYRKSQSPFVSEDSLHRTSLARFGKRKISAETQTKVGSKRRCPTVSSEVQTMGEYVVKFGKRQPDNLASQGIQCRISPVKKMASSTSTATCTHYEDLLTVDIPGAEDLLKSLRPLHRNTNGTQTSPRVKSILTSRLSIESLEEDEDIEEVLSMPSLEHINAPDQLMLTAIDECSSRPPKLGEIRQFSTETQTDLDVFLNQGDNWTSVDGTEAAMDDFAEDIDFLTSNMETQTSSDMLLCANIYTQTGSEYLLPHALKQGVSGHQVPPDYTCSAETQTSLTGFESVLDQPGMVTDQGLMNHIETQTINEFCAQVSTTEQLF